MEQKQESIVKRTCKELGITQKKLAEILGISESSIKRIASSEPTKQIENSIKLLLENYQLKQDLFKIEEFQNNLKNFLYIDTKKYKAVLI